MSRGLRHLALKTRDLAATERFYVEVLGLRVAFPHRGMLFLESSSFVRARNPRGPGSGARRARTGGDGGDLLNFVATRRAFDPEAGGLDHFGLRVPAAEWARLMARLKTSGVRIRGRRGRSAVYIRDPNGYTVELYRD